MVQAEAALTTVKTNNHPVATEPAMNLEDVYGKIFHLVSEMKTIAARQTEAEHTSKINEFFVCDPPTFGEDSTDPLLAKQWILGLENIFDCIGCSDKQKVAFAGLRLKDAALSWWIVSKRNLKTDGVTVTWEKFKELFDKRYFPRWLKYEKYRELCNLEQGDRTVAEYDAEFMKLSSLVSELIPDDAWEASLFDNGLSPEIRLQLCSVNSMSYPEIRDMALRLERRLNAQHA